MKNKKSQLKIQARKNQRFLVPQSSKAQLKIQEMVFMLLAVVILFIIAGLFFIVVKYRDLYNQANLLEEERIRSLVAKISETAEFNCGEPLCIDTDKLIVMKKRPAYSGFWPVKGLYVQKMFPKPEGKIECTSENYPDCDFFIVYEEQGNIEAVSTYVALCRKELKDGYWLDKCELGEIVAGMEVKQPE